MNAYDSVVKLKSRKFEDALQELEAELRYIFNTYWPSEMFSDFQKRCSLLLKKDAISENEILRCWHMKTRNTGSIELKERFFYSMLYFLGADQEHYKGHEDTAGLLAMRSTHELGRFDGWRQCMAIINISYNGRIKGGHAGKFIREDAYLMLLKYIHSGPTKKNLTWKVKEDVVRDCSERLQAYMKEKYPSFSFLAGNFIENSLRNNGSVKDAFLSYKKAAKDKNHTDSPPIDQINSQSAEANADLTFDQRLSFLQRQQNWTSSANETDSPSD